MEFDSFFFFGFFLDLGKEMGENYIFMTWCW